MALDEALLDTAQPGTAALRFYQWAGNPPYALTFGYSQPQAQALESARQRYGGAVLPVVRRLTGGGVVFHDGDLTFSFIFPWPRLIGASLIYKDIHLGAHLGLRARGTSTRLWSPRRKGDGIAAECFTAPETADLVLESGEKILGGALRRRRGFGLYQGSLRCEGLGLSQEKLRDALAEGLGLQWQALWRPEEPRPATAALGNDLRRKRYSTEAWNGKR
jgi:lipoate-protein ligase A